MYFFSHTLFLYKIIMIKLYTGVGVIYIGIYACGGLRLTRCVTHSCVQDSLYDDSMSDLFCVYQYAYYV